MGCKRETSTETASRTWTLQGSWVKGIRVETSFVFVRLKGNVQRKPDPRSSRWVWPNPSGYSLTHPAYGSRCRKFTQMDRWLRVWGTSEWGASPEGSVPRQRALPFRSWAAPVPHGAEEVRTPWPGPVVVDWERGRFRGLFRGPGGWGLGGPLLPMELSSSTLLPSVETNPLPSMSRGARVWPAGRGRPGSESRKFSVPLGSSPPSLTLRPPLPQAQGLPCLWLITLESPLSSWINN